MALATLKTALEATDEATGEDLVDDRAALIAVGMEVAGLARQALDRIAAACGRPAQTAGQRLRDAPAAQPAVVAAEITGVMGSGGPGTLDLLGVVRPRTSRHP